MTRPHLVLLPGLDGTGVLFRPLLSALPKEVRAKVVTYPSTAPLDLSELAALVLRQLPAERVVLLAESFSGLVTLALLASAAARVRGVIFVGAFAEPPRPLLLRFAPLVSHAGGLIRSIPSFFLRRYCLGAHATASELNALREAIAAVAPAVLAQRLALIAKRHSFGTPPGNVPAYYMKATADKLVPPSCASWFEQRFTPCAVEEVRGPHFLLQANPRDSAAVITRALRGSRMISKQYAIDVRLKRAEVPSFDSYPFSLPAVRHLDVLKLHPCVTYVIGENGSGKSTLLEAIAVSCGFNPEGGTKNFRFGTRTSHSNLHEYLRLGKGVRKPRDGFFLRAESFFNVATEIERLDAEGMGPRVIDSYGGKSLHEQSHGESFLALNYRRLGYAQDDAISLGKRLVADA